MALLQTITVKETSGELTKLLRGATTAIKPRIKMLLGILEGTTATQDLVAKTKANRDSIRNWKNTYRAHGIDGLTEEARGNKRPGAITEEYRVVLEQKLTDPKGGFTSYIQATEWINQTLGLNMNYHAVNKYFKRHFGTKLKTGRKSHVNKDENAAALFKKTM